jgi:hypothetical protein
MSLFIKILLMVLGAGGGLFAVTFLIYFFNLDMKFMVYAVEPILQKVYNKASRKYYV